MKAQSARYLRRSWWSGACRHRWPVDGATSGFSLVEVVLALGFLALTLIPLIGILTHVNQKRYQSDSIFLSSSIANKIISEVHQANRAQIDAWAGSPRLDYYFNYEGLEVSSVDEAAFTARLVIEKVPITLGAGVENSYLGKVKVHVCRIPGADGARVIDEMISSNPNRQPRSIRTYPSVIVDLEK